MIKFHPDHFGVPGFHPIKPRKIAAVNLFHIQNLADKGRLEKSGSMLKFEFDGKILGSGALRQAVEVVALGFSKGAAEKIAAAGGSAKSTLPEAATVA